MLYTFQTDDKYEAEQVMHAAELRDGAEEFMRWLVMKSEQEETVNVHEAIEYLQDCVTVTI